MLCAFLASIGDALAGSLMIGQFSAKDLSGWESKEFAGDTIYSLTRLDGQDVLKAVSDNSASGLFKKIKIDIKKTPYLNWRWRIENRLTPLIETEKSGDDYSARIYIVVSTGIFFWQTRALNYVWSSQAAPASNWPNAFAPNNARMIAVRTSDHKLATWYHEKRNIYQELKQWLGDEVIAIDAIAIMTDTDNSHSHATAYYGDIYFSSN